MEIIKDTLHVPFNGKTLVFDIEMRHPTYLKYVAISFGRTVVSEILDYLGVEYDKIDIKIS